MKILMLYFSKTGHTLEAANATAEGIRTAGAEVDIVDVCDFKAAVVAEYEGLILASPCWAGSVTPWGVARPVLRALDGLPPDARQGMRCGGISVHATMGGETTVKSLGNLLSEKEPSVSSQDEARFKAYRSEFVGTGTR